MDIISLQEGKVLQSYNLNDISTNNKFPLDYRGVPVSGALTYPSLVSTYEGNRIRLIEPNIDSVY